MHTTQRADAVRVIDATIKELQGLRKSLAFGTEADRHSGAQIDPDHVRQVGQRIRAHWDEREPDGFYRGSGFVIDLKSVEGRAQLLVLANLLAAKTTEAVAERTFLALGEAGLLQPERLAEGRPNDREHALQILQQTYKAVSDKVRKVEAIYDNQARLAAEWSGDLNTIYQFYEGDDEQIIKALQGFAHLQRRAFWLAREMKVCGVWPSVGPQATAYYDGHVRRVLSRLGFAGTASGTWRASREECQTAVTTWFGGDFVPLYLHGSRLCIHDDRPLCGGSCPVKENCSFWSRGSEQYRREGSD